MNFVPLIRITRRLKWLVRNILGIIVAAIALPIAFLVFLCAALVDCVLPSRAWKKK